MGKDNFGKTQKTTKGGIKMERLTKEQIEEIKDDVSRLCYATMGRVEEERIVESTHRAIDELVQYRKLEEGIGCPLEVRSQIYEGQEVYNRLGDKRIISRVEQFTFEVYNPNNSWDRVDVSYSDHKITWWLKADRSE